ncbi:MAG: serine/threonine-protein kinase, partial [Myxococcota bacterium]
MLTPTPSRVGEVLGERFELVQQIGKGGMGVVYLARDRQLPRPVAVKILLSRDPALEQRFRDEVEILGTLSHPHLVAPLGSGRTAAGQLYMAMEYIRGENLSQRLGELGPLGWREALQVGIQIGEVLEVLHAAGVLHRDIKPSNIMLCDGAALVAKVIDLGVAKKQPAQWPDAAAPRGRFHTELGVAVGTPLYQPPEAGFVSPDPRFDVFGLAATIYELCTGKSPERGPYRPIERDAPPELDAVLSAALAADPAARTESVPALLDGLRRTLDESGPAPLFDGRYELLRPLGAGAKGEVVLAHHRRSRRDVALKLLHVDRQTTEEQQRMRREAQVLSLLRHPAFPTLHDLHEHAGRVYLAMELVAGQRASKFRDAPLSPAHVIEVGIQLAQALLALRELGVLHRDIHMGNVLIDFECGPVARPIVKLVDLGMCELLPAFYARVHRYGTPPESRVVLGTGGLEQFDWTAPEARRERRWSEKSDVWSVGLVLYQLLTGRRPFRPRSEDPPECPREWAPKCCDELADALLAALQPDPILRLDAAGLLDRLLGARETQALEEAEPAKVIPFPRSRRGDETQAVEPAPASEKGPEPLASAASEPAAARAE